MRSLPRLAILLGSTLAALAPQIVWAAETGHVEQPGIINLNITLVIQAINFLILILLLSRFLFRPLTEFLAKRTEGIQRSLAEAEEAREAEVERQRLQAAARTEAERVLAEARSEIAAETRRAKTALREEAVALSLAAAERVLGRAITAEDQRRLAEQYVRELGTTN